MYYGPISTTQKSDRTILLCNLARAASIETMMELSDDGRRSASVLILTHFHPPEPCAAANRVASLTRALEENGFDVHVVTGVANFPNGAIARGDAVIFPRSTRQGSVRLTRVWTYASTNLTGRSRILNWLSVASSMTAYVATLRRRYEFVVVTMPPITLALPALVAMVRHRAQLVVDVRDVFPDVAVKMGYWRANGLAAKAVGFISAAAYRAARLVLCVTESAKEEIVARGSARVKTIVASNGFDPVRVAPRSPYDRQPGEFVAAFVGNMGLATGLDVIIDAASALKGEPRIRFVLAGGGADSGRLAARVAGEELENVVMLGVVPRDAANALIADADASIVPLHPAISDSLPTKLFDALILGCPVVCCAEGEARRFVERSGGGIALPPNDGVRLADALRTLLADPASRCVYATSGRAFVLQNYDRSKVMNMVAKRLVALRLDVH